MKYEVNITLKHLVFGYKTFDKDFSQYTKRTIYQSKKKEL